MQLRLDEYYYRLHQHRQFQLASCQLPFRAVIRASRPVFFSTTKFMLLNPLGQCLRSRCRWDDR